VEVVHAGPRSLRRVVEQPGTIQAYEETQLYARVPGYVSRVLLDIGQKVRGPRYDAQGKEVEPGQVLAEISVPEMEEELNHKKALVRQAEADARQARKALAAAEAHIATTEAAVVEAKAGEERWASEARRIGRMVQGGVVDAQTLDETRNQHKAAGARVLSAEAAVKKSTADRDKMKADVRSAEARVDVARAEARRLEVLLGYAKIRAPFDGVVTVRKVNTGDFVQPAVGKGDWLFTVARFDPLRVVVDVPEADAALVEEKSVVSLSIPALRGPALTAKVARTSGALAPRSRTLRAEIDLPNKDGKLRPGMYVHARVTAEQPARWALPASALVKQGDVTVCYLVEGGKAVRTPVQAGPSDGQFTEVLKLQRAGSSARADWTAKEEVAAKAAGLTDGQEVQRSAAGK
jgi:multidrug efflux pump subunit AcrA (membrane-fusion protein)